jgi:predicted nucleic acid-binding protein
VVAAAVAARAHLIVSGDKHLLNLKDRIAIPVLKAGEALQFLVGK